jgi:hypothetical protein
MQDKETHNIDNIFGRGMAQLSEETPSSLGWENLKKEMKKEGIKIVEEKKGHKLFWVALFSSLLIVSGASTYFFANHSANKGTIEEPATVALDSEAPKKEKLTTENTSAINEEIEKNVAKEITEKAPMIENKESSTKEAEKNITNTKPEKDKAKNKNTSLLSVYSIRVASFSGKVDDAELNAIPNLKSEYNAGDDATTFYIGGFKSKEEAISGMKRIQKEFNSRIDPNDASSQKNLKDAYKLFEEELNKL